MENQYPKKLSKQEYNKLYYQKNKERLQKKKGDTMGNKLQLVVVEKNEQTEPDAFRKTFAIVLRGLELLALVVLTLSMTYFQIHESANFYQEASDSLRVAYCKAGLIETAVILFSFSRSKITLVRWGQRTALLVLCCLTLSTMSGKITQDASQNTTKAIVVADTIRDLEVEKLQKEELRQEFVKRGRITVAKQYERHLDAVREKIASARQSLTVMQAPKVVATGLGILLAMRVLAMMINLICIHRLAEILGLWTSHKQPA